MVKENQASLPSSPPPAPSPALGSGLPLLPEDYVDELLENLRYNVNLNREPRITFVSRTGNRPSGSPLTFTRATAGERTKRAHSSASWNMIAAPDGDVDSSTEGVHDSYAESADSRQDDADVSCASIACTHAIRGTENDSFGGGGRGRAKLARMDVCKLDWTTFAGRGEEWKPCRDDVGDGRGDDGSEWWEDAGPGVTPGEFFLVPCVRHFECIVRSWPKVIFPYSSIREIVAISTIRYSQQKIGYGKLWRWLGTFVIAFLAVVVDPSEGKAAWKNTESSSIYKKKRRLCFRIVFVHDSIAPTWRCVSLCARCSQRLLDDLRASVSRRKNFRIQKEERSTLFFRSTRNSRLNVDAVPSDQSGGTSTWA